jgi:tRNA(fMet)-specific endonuclease VapC
MRQNPVVIAKARKYLAEYNQFTFSIIIRFEILRGLKAKSATTQARVFDEFYLLLTKLWSKQQIFMGT